MPNGLSPQTPSIRQRLLRSTLATLLVGALLSAGAAAFAVSQVVAALSASALEETAQALVVLAEHEQDVEALARGQVLPAAPHSEIVIWQLRASDGSLIARSHDAPAQPWDVPLFVGHLRTASLAVYTIAGKRLWLQVGQPLNDLRRAQYAAALQTAGAVIAFSLVAAAVVASRIRREMQPLARLVRDVEAISPGATAMTPPRSPRQELEPVYAALDGLLRRLADKLRSEHAFASHAAHSLRTPLAGLSAQLEVARLQAGPEIAGRIGLALDSARRLGSVVEALLTMARASATLQWRDFAAQELAPVAIGRRLEVDVGDLIRAAPLHGDPDLLAVAVANLVDNAARHGARRACIKVCVDDREQRIAVADDGPGVDPDGLAVLRGAVKRLDGSGEIDAVLGLGLTLAASVARAHGGRLDLDCESAPLQGFCARLSWPRSGRAAGAPRAE